MRNIGLVVVALAISACATNPDVTVKVEASPQDYKILMGEFDGSLALIHGSPKNARIEVTDGSFSCVGISTTGTFRTDMRKNYVTHLFNFTCDDGSAGQVLLKVTMKGNGEANGVGVGSLSNGSKIKVVVGEMTGTLAW